RVSARIVPRWIWILGGLGVVCIALAIALGRAIRTRGRPSPPPIVTKRDSEGGGEPGGGPSKLAPTSPSVGVAEAAPKPALRPALTPMGPPAPPQVNAPVSP